jgi:hypothetical protein
MCKYMGWWDELFESLPATVQTLIIPECYSYVPFEIFRDLKGSARSIQRLEIGRPLVDLETFALHHFISRFPAVTTLTLPVTIALETDAVGILDGEDNIGSSSAPPRLKHVEKDSLVEVLTFARPLVVPAFGFDGSLALEIDFLKTMVTKFPLLRRLNVPQESVKHADEEELVELSELLEGRASSEKIRHAGIFTYEEDIT